MNISGLAPAIRRFVKLKRANLPAATGGRRARWPCAACDRRLFSPYGRSQVARG
jgi:hypothetical protein